MDEQQIYGVIINLFVNGLTVNKVCHPYSDFFGNSQLWERTKEEKDSLTTKVAELTIKKAQNKAEQIMKTAAKRRTDKKKSLLQEATRNGLNRLSSHQQDILMR